MVYGWMKTLIQNNSYVKEDMLKKMDLFLLFGRITPEQYAELKGLMETVVV